MQKNPDFQQQKQEVKEIKQIQQDCLLWNDSNKDFLQKCEIVFDHVKLLTFLSQEEIQHLDDTLNDKKDNAPRGILEYVPIQALPAVHQYLGKQYRCLHPSIKQSYEIQKYKFKDVSYLNGMTFPNLVILNLSSQLIQNLQALAFISAPQLKALQLYDNKICNMDALVKADFPHLEAITFYLNPIRKMEQFYRFHAKKLKTYEFDNVKQATCPYQDYRFLFKREDTIPLKIKVQNRFRINMKKKPYFTALNQPGTNILFYDKRRYRNGVRILRS